MKKILWQILGLIIFFFTASEIHSQEKVYNWDWKKDGVILGSSFAFWGGSQYLKSRTNEITAEDLPLRDPENLWGIDKGATNNYSTKAANLSDIFLYTSFALPYTHYLGSTCRNNEGLAITGMALEAFLITDGITNVIKGLTKRFRPFTYNPEVSIENKLVPGARFSFISGHSSNTAALGFFTAKVFSDLYPDNKWKPLVWGLGVTLPAATGYMRYKAGKHFPTDIIGGYLLGATIGYLVPHFHKISKKKDMSLKLLPAQNGMVLSFNWNLK